MSTGQNNLQNGWGEYSHLVLTKLDDLQKEQREIRKSLDTVHSRLTKLESNQEKIKDLSSWKNMVNDVWSPAQMKEGKDEIYKQKERWTGATWLFIAAQVMWALIMAFKDKIFN